MSGTTDKLASAIGDRTDPSNLGLVKGVVVALGPPIRVDSAGLQLSCTTLAGVSVGQIVWVAQVGNLNVILGAETSEQVRHGNSGIVATIGGGVANYTFSGGAFPSTINSVVFTNVVGSGVPIIGYITARGLAGFQVQWYNSASGIALGAGVNTNIDYVAWGT